MCGQFSIAGACAWLVLALVLSGPRSSPAQERQATSRVAADAKTLVGIAVPGPAPATTAPAPPRPELPRDPHREAAAAAKRTVSSFASGAARVHHELREARARKDAPRAGCLDELLTRVHVAERTGRALLDRIDLARAREDTLSAERDLVRVAYLGARFGRLVREADRCGRPELATGTGSTVVRVSVAPSLPAHADGYASQDRR